MARYLGNVFPFYLPFSVSPSLDRLNGRPMKYLVIQGKFLAHVSVKRMRTAEPEDDLWGNKIGEERTEKERAAEMNQLMNFKHAYTFVIKRTPLSVRCLFTIEFISTLTQPQRWISFRYEPHPIGYYLDITPILDQYYTDKRIEPGVNVIKNISATRKGAFETGSRGILIKRHASPHRRRARLASLRYDAGIYEGSKQEAAHAVASCLWISSMKLIYHDGRQSYRGIRSCPRTHVINIVYD